MEAFVWAATDPHLGVCIGTRAYGDLGDAAADVQEAVGDKCPISWHLPDGSPVADPRVAALVDVTELVGDFTDTEGRAGHVTISLVKVRLP